MVSTDIIKAIKKCEHTGKEDHSYGHACVDSNRKNFEKACRKPYKRQQLGRFAHLVKKNLV